MNESSVATTSVGTLNGRGDGVRLVLNIHVLVATTKSIKLIWLKKRQVEQLADRWSAKPSASTALAQQSGGVKCISGGD